jgi:polyferredoxin
MLNRILFAFFALFFLLSSLGMWLFAAAGIVLQIHGFDPGYVFMAVVAVILALVSGSCCRDAWRAVRYH